MKPELVAKIGHLEPLEEKELIDYYIDHNEPITDQNPFRLKKMNYFELLHIDQNNFSPSELKKI